METDIIATVRQGICIRVKVRQLDVQPEGNLNNKELLRERDKFNNKKEILNNSF